MIFASWSYDVSVIDLRERPGLADGKAVAKKERGSDVFQENEEWTVEWISIERNEVRIEMTNTLGPSFSKCKTEMAY